MYLNLSLAYGIWWNRGKAIFGQIGTMPHIVMNKRLTSTAGRAWVESGKIDFSDSLYRRNPQYFHEYIVPHEICHIIAYRLYGDAGHSKTFKAVCRKMGISDSTCYDPSKFTGR